MSRIAWSKVNPCTLYCVKQNAGDIGICCRRIEYPFQLIDFLSGKIGMMEPSRPSNPELGILESSGLNKTQAGGFVHMMYKSSISKNISKSVNHLRAPGTIPGLRGCEAEMF